MKKFNTLNVVTTAMLCSLAVILARAFHHLAGMDISALFSPMHLPILLAGILCGPWLGLIAGFLCPVVSFAVSGMPPFPNSLVPMALELAAYGFFTGLLRGIFIKNPKTHKFAVILALAASMIIGRAINAVTGAALLSATGGTPFFPTLWAKFLGNFASTWAGIVLQIVLIPSLLFCLQKSGVLIKYLPEPAETASP